MTRLTPFAAALLSAAVTSAALPAMAQDVVLLLRVYIDTPYFYELIAEPLADNDAGTYHLKVFVEGKEVGESEVMYHCADGTYEETVTSEWTGGSANYLPAALMAFKDLWC